MSPPGTATRRRESGSEPRATYQDVLDAPPHRVAEIVDGVLYTHPRPAMPHALATSSLGHDLTGPFQFGRGGPGGWRIIDEPELHLGEDILVPDLAGWRRERMPGYPDAAYCTLAPDWVCEVISPSTRKLDLHGKRPIYARERCRAPVACRTDGSHPGGPSSRATESGSCSRPRRTTPQSASVPFEAVTFSLGDLWP